jgi:hypothetical protein
VSTWAQGFPGSSSFQRSIHAAKNQAQQPTASAT